MRRVPFVIKLITHVKKEKKINNEIRIQFNLRTKQKYSKPTNAYSTKYFKKTYK